MTNKPCLGFALCGSFCTFDRVITQIKLMSKDYTILPIMSNIAYTTDTRFGKADHFINKLKEITGNDVISTIPAAEPIGPKSLLDLLVIAPCTGNTLAKLALGITDTSVTMSAKAHMRNNRPIVIAVSTNDALGISAKNIGALLSMRNIYFVPMTQDDPKTKARSIVALMEQLPETVAYALNNSQLQPLLGQ